MMNDDLKKRISELERDLGGRINAVFNLEQCIDVKIGEIESLQAENAELKENIKEMVEKAASKHLPAYREAAMKFLDSETKRMDLQSIVSNHRIIEWFNAVEDTNKQYLEEADYHLKGRIEYAKTKAK